MNTQLDPQHQTKKNKMKQLRYSSWQTYQIFPSLIDHSRQPYTWLFCVREQSVRVCIREREREVVQFNINLLVQSQQHQILHQEHHMDCQLNCNQHEVGSLNAWMTSANFVLQKTSDLLEALQGNNPKLDLPNKEAPIINREYSWVKEIEDMLDLSKVTINFIFLSVL